MTKEENSCFTYKVGTSHATFHDEQFTPTFTTEATEAERQAAEAFCGMFL